MLQKSNHRVSYLPKTCYHTCLCWQYQCAERETLPLWEWSLVKGKLSYCRSEVWVNGKLSHCKSGVWVNGKLSHCKCGVWVKGKLSHCKSGVWVKGKLSHCKSGVWMNGKLSHCKSGVWVNGKLSHCKSGVWVKGKLSYLKELSLCEREFERKGIAPLWIIPQITNIDINTCIAIHDMLKQNWKIWRFHCLI